jgi:hypothetical protein
MIVGLFAAAALLAEGPPGADEWKYDVIYLKSGPNRILRGLIVAEKGDNITIKTITRKPGVPTLVFTHYISRRDVSRLDPLSAKERDVLRGRLEAVLRQRQLLAAQLKSLTPKGKGAGHLEVVHLHAADWPTKAGGKAMGYKSAHFHLVSNARPELVHLAAIHLEQVYAAYVRALPPRAKGEPTTILLTRSRADYQALTDGGKFTLFNPAFYDPKKNRVVCGGDFGRMCDELERVRTHHAKLLRDIKERKSDLRKAYKGLPPDELRKPLIDAEKNIAKAELRNQRSFEDFSQRLFRVLYHEAFHAYLTTFVYPSKDGSLPNWFNEGLAQIFESAIVEAGELRIGHAGDKRPPAVRRALAKGQLPGLMDVLRSGEEQFRVVHASDKRVADRYYVASWALAFYLTFDRKVLGTKALDEYVAALARPDSDPVAAFRRLVGQPLDQFEKEYHAYLKALRADGTTGKRET